MTGMVVFAYADRYAEGARAMADGMFLRRIDFAEGSVHPVGNKNRIVTKDVGAARGKDQLAAHVALEDLRFAGRRGERRDHS